MKSKEFAWRNMKIVMAGRPITGVTDLRYKLSRTVSKVFGAGDEAHSITKGNKEPMGSITLLQSEFEALRLTATALGLDDVTDLTFDIIVNYSINITDPMTTDSLLECNISEFEKGMAQNDPNMAVTFQLNIGKIKYGI